MRTGKSVGPRAAGLFRREGEKESNAYGTVFKAAGGEEKADS